MEFDGREYSLQLASDVLNDGMALELIDGPPESGSIVAGMFYSDRDGSMEFRQYARRVPDAALAWLREQATRRLPPRSDAV